MTNYLTFPYQGVYNDKFDNEKNFLIIRRGDIIFKSENERLVVNDILGTGSYGQVFKVMSEDGMSYALKIFKNKNSYYKHGCSEVYFLEKLRSSQYSEFFVKIYDSFIFKNHLCIQQELLGKNLYEVLKITKFKGFDHVITQRIGYQILLGLKALRKMNIVHCDIKPENILISDLENVKIKIIDFGNAFIGSSESIFYIQSRYYRAPEVILGINYGSAIDIWSFGSLLYEIFIGFPLFPGKNNADQIFRIEQLLGKIPHFMIEYGVNAKKYKLNNKCCYTNNLKILKDKIFKRDYQFLQNENLYDFIVFALQINPLQRPSVYDCLNHVYFNELNKLDTDEIHRRESAFEIERDQPNPEPEEEITHRNSIYDINSFYEFKDKDRKYSVHEKENKKDE